MGPIWDPFCLFSSCEEVEEEAAMPPPEVTGYGAPAEFGYEKGGFHLIELHLSTAGYGVATIILLLAAAAAGIYGSRWRKERRMRRRRRRLLEEETAEAWRRHPWSRTWTGDWADGVQLPPTRRALPAAGPNYAPCAPPQPATVEEEEPDDRRYTRTREPREARSPLRAFVQT